MADTPLLSPALLEWLSKEVATDYEAVEKLIKESANDPESEPYKSLYTSREHLTNIKQKLEKTCSNELTNTDGYRSLFGHLKLQFGMNYIQTEETGRGQECFEQILNEFTDFPQLPLVAHPLMESMNQLGILWANRCEHEQALKLLLQAKTLYENYKGKPLPIAANDVFLGQIRQESLRERTFEDIHTHTLFYLAQVYSSLEEPKVSAEYCQCTLSRQLETNTYDPIEWSLNAATISQYYLGVENFLQARHCLASAELVLSRVDQNNVAVRKKLDLAKADFSRCWIKYCIVLFKTSIDYKNGEEWDGDMTRYRFEALEVSALEDEVQCKMVDDYATAQKVFLFGQRHVERSKTYFTLDSLASDHASIVQDHSQLFKLLTCFETDLSIKCRMHKRRLDLLTAIVLEFNPQHFLPLIRQLEFEIGETYREMVDLKIILNSEDSNNPSMHSIKKINSLVTNSITHFQKFVDSFEEVVNPPDLRSYLSAILNIARLHSKHIFSSVADEIACNERSLATYKKLVQLKAKFGEDAVLRVFNEEMRIVEEMAELLPLKLKRLNS